jgi:glutathione S-transferase
MLAAMTTSTFDLHPASASSSPKCGDDDAVATITTAEDDWWPDMTLYGDLNMRPFRNAWMLEEIGMPYVHVPCMPRSRIARMVHPMGKVPALLVVERRRRRPPPRGGDDGDVGRSVDSNPPRFVILESAAINTYLGDMAREGAIMTTSARRPHHDNCRRNHELVPPPATHQRARYEHLIMFVMSEIDSQSLWVHRKHSPPPHGLSNLFGDAPAAVFEARRQFDGALDVMVGDIFGFIVADMNGDVDGDDIVNVNDDDRGGYLLSTGFSAVDILFVHCCSWAQQIGWLEGGKTTNRGGTLDDDVTVTPTTMTTAMTTKTTNSTTTTAPKRLVPELGAYLERCRSRPAYVRVNGLRRDQVYERKDRGGGGGGIAADSRL